jgi:hypothetical protein
MKLGELQNIINRTINDNPLAKDCEVTIPISGENGIGSTPSVSVRSAGKGFDWDGYMFMIFPDTHLYKKNQKVVNIQKVDTFDNRKR